MEYNLTTDEIAQKFGYHPQYVRFAASKGKIPGVKRGREWRFNEAEVLAHFKKQTNDQIRSANESDDIFG